MTRRANANVLAAILDGGGCRKSWCLKQRYAKCLRYPRYAEDVQVRGQVDNLPMAMAMITE